MNTVYVIGHKNPDTDSICSAIAYSNFKNAISGEHKYLPARLGDINNETQFVLNFFNVKTPELLDNVYSQVSDIDYDRPLNVEKITPVFEVWKAMISQNVRTVNIVDEQGRFSGIATLGDIAKAYLESDNDFNHRSIPINNIIKTLNGTALILKDEFFSGKMVVAAMHSEDVRQRIRPGDLLIAGNRESVHLTAIDGGAKVLIITGNHDVSHKVLGMAKEMSVNLIKVPYDTFDAVKLITQSFPVHYIMKTKDLKVFHLTEFLDDVKETMMKFKYRNFPVVDDEKKPVGMLTRRHILNHKGKKVILVDHNEKSQSVEGLEQAKILEIIDHHRIASLQSQEPIMFINRPVGCTATIIYDLYMKNGIRPSKKDAGIMCASIISDTLLFKSPTCTPEDINAANDLAALAGIDLQKFAMAMFEAGTTLIGKSEKEIFYTDFKEFHIGQFKIGISQMNVMGRCPESLKVRLIDFMEKLRENKNYDFLLLMLTDIIDEVSEFLYVGNHKGILNRAFDVNIKGNSFYLPHVVSRKKQVISKIISAINSDLG